MRGARTPSDADARVLLVGNLHADAELAADAARARGAPSGVVAGAALPATLMRRLAAASTLLRVLGDQGDALWTSMPVASERVLPVDGLPRPESTSAPLAAVLAGRRAVAWSSTSTLDRATSVGARHDAQAPGDAAEARGSPGREHVHGEEPLWRRLRAALRSDGEVQRRVASRAFAASLAESVGGAPRGVCAVSSWDALRAHLRAGGCDASPRRRFVLKPPHSAAGRGHILGVYDGRRDDTQDRAFRRRVEAHLAVHGELWFEPWLERVAEFGQGGLVHACGASLVSAHGLHTDGAGRFVGVAVPPEGARPAGLGPDDAAHLAAATAAVGAALHVYGYRGPFAVDAFVHRTTSGACALRPVVEVNARLTFGLLARALAERLPRGGDGLLLRLGRAPAALPADACRLLAPGPDDDSAAWVTDAHRPETGEPAVGTRPAAPRADG